MPRLELDTPSLGGPLDLVEAAGKAPQGTQPAVPWNIQLYLGITLASR